MLICLEGIDGSGKTSIASAVSTLFPGDVKFQSRKTIPSCSSYANSIANQLADLLWRSGDSRDIDSVFWLYLQAAWFTLLGGHYDRAPTVTIVDGWYYRFAARLLVQGVSAQHVESAFCAVPRPDAVILLDVEPSIAWGRKRYRPLETGLHLAEAGSGFEGFVKYQGGTLRVLREFAEREQWITLNVSAEENFEATAQRVSDLLQKLCPSAYGS